MRAILAVITAGVITITPLPSDELPLANLIKETIQEEQLLAEPVYTAATAVADCESGDILKDGTAVPFSYSLTAENPISSASGKYQFINSTWESTTGLPAPASAYPEETQDQAFNKLWDDGNGSFHWNPSRHCWEDKIP